MISYNQYIKEYFIELSICKIPPSLYVIRKSILTAVNELKPSIKGVVLDLGCGVMPYKDYLNNPLIEKYIGIDVENSIYHNSVKPDLYWDGVNIPMEDSSCDYVIATEFFEHYYDINHILKEIMRVLKKDGILFFTVPSIWPIHEAPYDYHRFTPFSLEKYFNIAKFSSWKIGSLGGFYVCLAIILSFWFEKKSSYVQWIIKPLFSKLIRFFLKNDKSFFPFRNGQFHSGLFGFVVK